MNAPAMNAFKLFTGPDNASHVLEGTLTLDQDAKVWAARFKESPPGLSFEWRETPERQYVITLLGTLAFTTRDGETFVIRPGDVLVASDTIGSGHKWRLIDDQPWRRCCAILEPHAPDLASVRWIVLRGPFWAPQDEEGGLAFRTGIGGFGRRGAATISAARSN